MVAFDTSFVVEALVETQPLHQTCAGILESPGVAGFADLREAASMSRRC